MCSPEGGCVDTAAAAVFKPQLVGDRITLSRVILAALKAQKSASYFPPKGSHSNSAKRTAPKFHFFLFLLITLLQACIS